MTEKFTEVFALCRREAGLTLQELADRTGFTKATIWNYEKGHWLPPVDKMEAICEAMGMTMGEFWEKYDSLGGSGADLGATGA